MSRLLIAAVLVLLTACVAARDPQLVPMKQAADSSMTCEQMAMEYKSNTEVARNKIEKNRSNDVKELLLAIFIWPGLMDMKNADGNEGNALLDRNVYLLEIAKGKSCAGADAWPQQPKRYTRIEQALPSHA